MTANKESTVSLSDVNNWELTLSNSVGPFRGSECVFDGGYHSGVALKCCHSVVHCSPLVSHGTSVTFWQLTSQIRTVHFRIHIHVSAMTGDNPCMCTSRPRIR